MTDKHARHCRRGPLARWWTKLWGGPQYNPRTGDIYAHMLSSRKFRQLIFVDLCVLLFAFVLVCVYSVREAAIAEKALDVLRDVTIAYFGLNVVQKGIEGRWGRKQSNGKDDTDG